MSKRPDTWMPFYIGDYLRDTSRLTTEGHGAYLLLIFDYWVSGQPLPDDDHQLAAVARLSLAKWKALRPTIARFFRVADGTWHHKRIDEELAAATANIGKRSAAGAAGAASRWGNRNATGNGNRMANASESHSGRIADANAPSPSPEGSDADASGVVPPPLAPLDPVKHIFDRGVAILGQQRRSLLGKMVKKYGPTVVLAAIVETENEVAIEPASYLIQCCEQKAKFNGNAKPSPATNLFEGAFRAAERYEQREGSRGLGGAPDEPLLDRVGPRRIAAGAD